MAKQAIEEESKAAPRAAFDKIASVILIKIYPKITPSKNLYELVYEDIEKLRKIMEHREESEEALAKDTGEVGAKKKEKITLLDRWINA